MENSTNKARGKKGYRNAVSGSSSLKKKPRVGRGLESSGISEGENGRKHP